MRIDSRAIFVCIAAAFLLLAPPVMAEEEASDESEEKSAQAESSPAPTAGGLELLEAKIAKGVEDREAVDENDSFATDDKVTVWLAVKNPEKASKVDVVWSIGDTEIHTFSLDIGESWRWRTWAQMKVSRAGDWNVEIRDTEGNALQSLAFTVSGSE